MKYKKMYIVNKQKISTKTLLAYFLLFCILPPFVGIPFVMYYAWRCGKQNHSAYFVLFLSLAFYWGAINATKTPGSGGDQFRYCIAYLNVPLIGFWKSLIYIYGNEYVLDPNRTSISGEFMNGVYNYLGYYITFGKYYLFACLYTVIEYMLIYTGLYKFCQNLKSPHIPIICGAVILGFFYLYFQYTLHIQKQFFAQSIIMYVLGSVSLKGKMTYKEWILTIIALFTHASMIIFIPFLCWGKLRRALTAKALLVVCFLFACLVYFAPQLAGNLTSEDTSSTFSYSIGRVANAENDNDGMSLNMLQVFVVGIPIGLIVIRQLWFNRKKILGFSPFVLNIVLLLLLAVAAMNNQPIAQYRYFMMIFAFMPFVYPFAFDNVKKRDLFLAFMSVLMIVWFYCQFDYIIYEYASELEIVLVPPFILTFFCNLGF